MTTALLLTLALAGGERIHPRDEGVNLVFNPTRFVSKHEYKFENLKEEAKSVYFLLPRNCQEHTITGFSYSVAGKVLDYKVVSETPGWQVARAEVPPSRNFSVIMDVKGVHWNGKLSREKSTLPDDIAPPPISDEKMKWYSAANPYVLRVEQPMREHLRRAGLTPLGNDFISAFTRIYSDMAKHFKYSSGAAELENAMENGSMNCNGANWWLEGAFEATQEAGYVGVPLHGIVMSEQGEIHAMSLVGKRGWSHLVPTDGVKFNDGNPDPYYLSGHVRTMLLFQEGLGDPSLDPKGGVVYRRPENNRVMRMPNPGGMMCAFEKHGNVADDFSRAYLGGKKLSFTQTPVTDFAALRRELAAAQGGNR